MAILGFALILVVFVFRRTIREAGEHASDVSLSEMRRIAQTLNWRQSMALRFMAYFITYTYFLAAYTVTMGFSHLAIMKLVQVSTGR